jgi:hypothetical protein
MADPHLGPPSPPAERSSGARPIVARLLLVACGVGLGILIFFAVVVLAVGAVCVYLD